MGRGIFFRKDRRGFFFFFKGKGFFFFGGGGGSESVGWGGVREGEVFLLETECEVGMGIGGLSLTWAKFFKNFSAGRKSLRILFVKSRTTTSFES